MGRTLFIHLGYPKTATTFLQRRVFPEIDNLRYLGRYLGLGDNIPLLNEWTRAFGFASEESFEARVNVLKESLLQEEIRVFSGIKENMPLLISDEGLLFRTLQPFDIPWFGMFNTSFKTLIRRLSKFADILGLDIKIILTLRKQSELIHSLYAERYFYYNKEHSTDSFEKYLKTAFKDLNYYDYGLNNLEFDVVVKDLTHTFGKKNLLLLNYEDLQIKPNHFFENLLAFIGSDQDTKNFVKSTSIKKDNVRIYSEQIRSANHLASSRNDKFLNMMVRFKKLLIGEKKPIILKSLYKKMMHLRSSRRLKVSITNEQRAFIEKHYEQSNIRLKQLNEGFNF